jgi:hypothetical protein
MTRNGKIARLPRAIRDELNRRLDDGEQGKDLVEWLNAHPDVQRVLTASFAGRPVTDGNLSDWKQGGFEDWKRHQEACEWVHMVAGEADQIDAEAGLLPLSDRLSTMVGFALGKRLRELASGTLTDADSHDKFMELLKELARLRHDDHVAAELRMTLEDFELNLRDRLRNRSLDAVPLRATATGAKP